jgi:PAS domain S-box-containing protein
MSRLKILDVNQATVKLYKAKSKEDLKENIGKIICAESFRGEVEEILKIAQGNCDFAFETVTQTLDGEKLNTYIHWKVISGFENTLSRVMISILDISAKKKAEETLRQSEQNYRELFEHMPSAVAVFQAVGEGDDFIFLDFNKKAEEIEGISRSEVFGKKMTKAFPGSVRLGILDVFRRVWKTGKEEYLQEGLYRDEKGKESWRENWVYRLPGGKVVAIYADITERKQTEEAIRISAARYRGLVESQIAVISRVNMKGEITFINEEFIRVFGKKREDWIGRTTDELIAKEDRERVSGVIEKAKSPPYITHSENRNITGKGIRWYRWENSAVLDLQGKVVELQFMGRDITEEREALNTLERREKLLEVVNFTATKLMETANWKQNTPAILERVGLNAEVDTILLMQTNAGRQPMELPQMLENMIVWLAPGIEQNQLVLQILSRIRPEAIFNQWRKKLSTGEAIVAESQSSRLKQTIMGALGIKKMAIIPILVEGGLWGILGFEQIQRDREWDDIDLDAFQTLGDSFASAIQRNNAYSALVDRETRLKAILDATTDAISVHSKTNRVYVNRAWYRLFGITKNEDLKRIASSDLIAPQDRPRYLEIRKAINANKPVHGLFEFKVKSMLFP